MKKILLILLMVTILGQSGYILHNEMAKPAIIEVSSTLQIVKDAAVINWGFRLMEFKHAPQFRKDLTYIQVMGIKKLQINMCNPGGIMHVGSALYDMLKAAKDRGLAINVHAEGFVASAAIPIFLLGDVRTMGDSAWLMLHPHNGKVSEYKSATENSMLEFWTEWWAAILADRTNLTKEEALEIVANDISKQSTFFMDKAAALKMGFITK